MTRPAIAVLALTTTALALTACTQPEPRNEVVSGALAAQWVDLPDGRVVVCVRSGGSPIRTVTCDWATATREGEQP